MHSDLCGPMPIESRGGAKYFLTFIDDKSRKTWIYFLHLKSQSLEKFKIFKNQIENLTNERILTLRSDNGGKYLSKQFGDYCQQEDISRQLTAPHTPSQNGVSERKNRTILERTRSMLIEGNVPTYLWAKAAKTAVYIMNKSPTRANLGLTPKEVFYNRKPNLQHLHIFGCLVYVHLDKSHRNKLQPRA
jgi:transposase InsO family protein